MQQLNVADRVRLFLEKFGERGLVVLKAAYEVAQDPNIDHRFGDFSFKHLVLKLSSAGFVYNPANVLRILEKEYGVVEKSYSSSSQTWWKFVDMEATRSVLNEYLGMSVEDPKLKALLVKYRCMEPRNTLEMLRRLALKESLTNGDRELFKNFVFNKLDKIVELIVEMEKYEEAFAGELAILREILNFADMVSSKLEKPRYTVSTRGAGALANVNTRASFIKNTTSYEGNTST
ncbi:MAG: hypothetical protein QXH02_00980 [Desulfurococcaceae archaeon]